MSIKEMTASQMEEKLLDLAHKVYDADKAYITARERFDVLDDNKKSFFAILVDAQEAKTTAEKERRALMSDDWMIQLDGLKAARFASVKAKVERDNYVRLWETLRSIMSSRNTEKRTNT